MNRIISSNGLVIVALAAMYLAGCAPTHPPCCHHYYSNFPCYGYYSTCWRPWPEECQTCPSYTEAHLIQIAPEPIPGPPGVPGPGVLPEPPIVPESGQRLPARPYR